MNTGNLNRTAAQLAQSLEMQQGFHGHRKPHPDIASSFSNLGLVHQEIGELYKALEMHEQTLEMLRAIL